MSWTGQIGDEPFARRASQSALIAENILGLGTSDLSTLAIARAACFTQQATLQIGDQVFADDCSVGFLTASNLSGTFGSNFAALYASLPDNGGNQIPMIHG